LRPGIARGRSCASILVIPQRKMRLCEALHGREDMTRVRAPWPDMGKLVREEGEGGEGAQLGVAWGAARGRHWEGLLRARAVCLLSAVREVEEEKEEREKKKKRKGKKRKERKRKIYGKFSKHENFRGENKRQFMKLVKIIFLKGRYMPN
jgi:hypothetical protein